MLSVQLEDSKVTFVNVQYAIPVFRGRFCDDVARPFQLACWGMHAWSAGCEKHRACREAARLEGSPNTSRMCAQLLPEVIFETDISLTKATRAISMVSRERIAQSLPGCAEALGVRVRVKASDKHDRQLQKRTKRAR